MPCLDEEDAIGGVIDAVPRERLATDGHEVEVVVVDGGSRDRSVEIAEARGARVVRSPRGYGRQYRRGFAEARGEVIVTTDSDGSYPVGDIPRLVALLVDGGHDFLSVNRFATLPIGAMPLLNIAGNLALTGAVNLLFGLRLADSQSGMWVLRREALAALSLTSDGMALSEEIKIEAFTRLDAREVAGTYAPRIGAAKLRRLRDGLGNLAFLARRRLGETR
jgi:glycosyltransferase involved in cell wall biosynthesis